MYCPDRTENTELLLAYAAGQLDAQSAKTLERHLEQCEPCRTLAAEQAEVWQALDVWDGACMPGHGSCRYRGGSA